MTEETLVAAPPAGGTVVGKFYPLAPPRSPGQGLPSPAGCPERLREMVDALFLDAPALLDGVDPDAFGVMLFHPEGDPCAGIVDAHGRIVACVMPLEWLVEHSADVPGVPPRPGYFFAVLAAPDLMARWALPPLRAPQGRALS